MRCYDRVLRFCTITITIIIIIIIMAIATINNSMP
jgi:hypothetical protein